MLSLHRRITQEYSATPLIQLCFLVVLAYFVVPEFFQLKDNTNEAAVAALCYIHTAGQLGPMCYGDENTKLSTWPRIQVARP